MKYDDYDLIEETINEVKKLQKNIEKIITIMNLLFEFYNFNEFKYDEKNNINSIDINNIDLDAKNNNNHSNIILFKNSSE